MSIETDILVIGAGPAGSTAAKHAALNGAQVLMIDKKSEIGSPKRCAEGASKEGLKFLGIEPNEKWVNRELTGVRLISPNGTNVRLNSERVKISEAGYILERKIFDKYMAMDAARAGVQIMVKTIATELRRSGDSLVVNAEHMDQPLEINAKIVIGADGPESRVGRWAGLKTTLKQKNMESCAQFEMAGVELEDPDSIEFYFGSVAPGGYAWVFPKANDVANVGLGIISTETDKTAYEHLLEFVKTCPSTQKAQPVELNVGGDPVGGMHKKLVTDNLVIVGDAASQVSPLTGGGIISGMKAGLFAGEVTAAAIAENNYSEKRLKEYQDKCEKELVPNFKKELKVKDYLFSLEDKELDSIAESFKDMEFEKINTRELIKVLIKVSPKALLKLGRLF